MTFVHRAGLVVLLAGAWIGCAEEPPPAPAPEPVAAPTPTPPTPMLPPRPAEPEEPTAQSLPIADDFEEEAATQITTTTYVAELDKLEAEISADETTAE